mmetsp:Transcript_59405/g.139963  ORF Transcript_59405/g.139963 Transcript_59405/m.139963 type:complete len:159 (-) Transcript_59405:259-735(-)
MLSSLVKDYQSKQSKLKDINEQNRKEALAATETVANLVTDGVTTNVTEVFATQKKLEKEVKGLQTNTSHFAKQTRQWLEMIDDFNNNLKEVGDFQNWAKTVEWDMKNIASALDYVARTDSRAPTAGFPAATVAGDFPVATAAPADETPAAEAKSRKKT